MPEAGTSETFASLPSIGSLYTSLICVGAVASRLLAAGSDDTSVACFADGRIASAAEAESIVRSARRMWAGIYRGLRWPSRRSMRSRIHAIVLT